QPFAPQFGSTTSVVVRLAVEFVAPEKAVTPGWVASCVGPYRLHLCPFEPGSPVLASWAAIRSNVASALATAAGGITLAGEVRTADLSASYPPIGPSPGVVRALLNGTASRSPAILPLTARSCESWLDGLPRVTSLSPLATNAIAAAAHNSAPALAKRTAEKRRFLLNERRVFI